MSDLFAAPPQPVDGIRVGIGGWTYAPWRDNFYPKGLVQRRELEYASRRLTAIEINGTYYGAQKPATYAKWAAETPEGFVFSAKAPMRIMQSRTLARTGPQIEDFVGGIAALGDRLGPIVWQFDAGRRIDRDDFAAFLGLLPPRAAGRALRHVLDVRDSGFVDAGYVALVRRHGFATVFTDSPDHPSFADVAADFVYARLMRARSEVATGYPAAELERWAQRALAWARGGEPDDLPRLSRDPAPPAQRRDVFVFFISAAKERNPAAAMALIERLRDRRAG
ncbi:DUF72 domain-containing protein [Vulcaniibacterium tengchongense]|uniref:Uncharacterized protein YecE (DUF72 family) n=1 Tax=Vulcaniibacterium tengchongense TaxID=1273429 RepID=A0A3N4VVW5_9GAMM|nr:DUF72 domain-containing protein [Vulcaniibacterium tengchongense]RPE77204.1 uncharacterized protein YecE (DUF72 family) [Vulcaniibacterium tengchongense]